MQERSALMQEWSDYIDPEDWWASGLERLIVPIAQQS